MRFVLPLNLRQVSPWASACLTAVLLSSLCWATPAVAEPGESREKKAPEAAQQNPFGDPFGEPPAAEDDPFRDLPPAVQQDARPRLEGPRRRPIRDALRDETKVAFIDTPLEEVVQYLKQLHNINIMFDKNGFKTANIEVDMPITRQIDGLTLGETLDIMLLDHGLHYHDRGNWLLITTEAGMNKWIGEQLAKETRISFNQTPLLHALATLSKIHNIPIDVEISTVVTHPAFTQGEVTMQQDRITLDKALTQILAEHDLRYERRDRGLWITSNTQGN